MRYFIFSMIFTCFLFSQNISNKDSNIFTDNKKFNVNDIIHIIFNNKAIIKYKKAFNEKSDKNINKKSPPLDIIKFLPEIKIKNSTSSSGNTSLDLNKNFNFYITGVITSNTGNNNYTLTAEHTITINNKTEKIIITGIINAKDILNNNSVYSKNIANINIYFQNYYISKNKINLNTNNIFEITNISKSTNTNNTNIINLKYKLKDKYKKKIILDYFNKIIELFFN